MKIEIELDSSVEIGWLQTILEYPRVDMNDVKHAMTSALYNLATEMESGTAWRPTYTKYFVEDDHEGIPVKSNHEGAYQTKMREVSLREALENQVFYAEVKSGALAYPYAVYDFVSVKPDDNGVNRLLGFIGKNWEPTYFQRAGLVATPQAGLIGGY